jgi:hypothetical protein
MEKFVKTALLKQKERLEQQEVQLEEVRKGELYKSLQEGLSKQHKPIDPKNFEDLFSSVRKGNPSDPIEIQLSKKGLYSHKNIEQDKTFTEILEEIEKGFPEEFIEIQLEPRRYE